MDRPIPLRRRLQGLVAAALAAWAMLSLPVLGPAALSALRASLLLPRSWAPELALVQGAVQLSAGFGIPLALAVTVPAGLPLWAALERRGLRSRGVALRVGAAAGGALALVLSGLGLALNLVEGFGAEGAERPPALTRAALWALFALWLALSGAVAGWAAWRVATRGGSAPG